MHIIPSQNLIPASSLDKPPNLSILGKPPKRIRQFVQRRRHQTHDGLERRLVRRTGVAARRDEVLGAREAGRHSLGLCVVNVGLEGGQVVALFGGDVLGEVVHEGFEGGEEFRVARF